MDESESFMEQSVKYVENFFAPAVIILNEFTAYICTVELVVSLLFSLNSSE